MQAPGAFADLTALRECWHPVAFAGELAGQPVHADLLGQPLVLWRGQDGRPRANSDLCVHRGTALSLGWVRGDELVCPYHGWRYRADGRCAAIPQLEDPSRVPRKARIGAFGCQERYGLIWVGAGGAALATA
jgi:phenylpropionate dioxygenase-like ring-hydroxylating dioxygenase large terminal subunit